MNCCMFSDRCQAGREIYSLIDEEELGSFRVNKKRACHVKDEVKTQLMDLSFSLLLTSNAI